MDREFLIKGYIVDGDKIINEQTGEEIPDMPVFVLHLSIRPLNVLNRETETIRKLPHNELCISDLLLQNPWEFRRLRNLGEKSAEEIISELKQYLENPEQYLKEKPASEMKPSEELVAESENTGISFFKLMEEDSKLSDQQRELLRQRMNGKSINDISWERGVSRARLYQVENSAFNRLTHYDKRLFEEDKFAYLYQTYQVPKDFFFDYLKQNEQTLYYLTVRYNHGTQEISSATEDENLSPEIREAVEQYNRKDTISIGDTQIFLSRIEIEEYLIRNCCQEDTTLEAFAVLYDRFIDEHDLRGSEVDGSEVYVIGSRTNRFANAPNILWKQNARMRYYNTDRDFTKLLETLNLGQYRDIELSTRKFIVDYPGLMDEYDIRDEYELHNLLKKIHAAKQNDTLEFRRMPTLVFGSFDRNQAVKDLIYANSPITADELTKLISRQYGVSIQTVKANWLKGVSEYFHHGYYVRPVEDDPDQLEMEEQKPVEKTTAAFSTAPAAVGVTKTGGRKVLTPREKLFRRIRREFPKKKLIGDIVIDDEEFEILIQYLRSQCRYLLTQCELFECDEMICVALVQIGIRYYSEGKYWPFVSEILKAPQYKDTHFNWLGNSFMDFMRQRGKILAPGKKNVANILMHGFVSDQRAGEFFDFLFMFYEIDLRCDINRLKEDRTLMAGLMENIKATGTQGHTYKLLEHTADAIRYNEKGGRIRLNRYLKLIHNVRWDSADLPKQSGNRMTRYFLNWCPNSEKLKEEQKNGRRSALKIGGGWSPYLKYAYKQDTFKLVLPSRLIYSKKQPIALWEIRYNDTTKYLPTEAFEAVTGYMTEETSYLIEKQHIFDSFELSLLSDEEIIRKWKIHQDQIRFFDLDGDQVETNSLRPGEAISFSSPEYLPESEAMYEKSSYDGLIMCSYLFEDGDLIIFPDRQVLSIGRRPVEGLLTRGLQEDVCALNGDNKFPVYETAPSVFARIHPASLNGTRLLVNGKPCRLFEDKQPLRGVHVFDLQEHTAEEGVQIALSSFGVSANGFYHVELDIPNDHANRKWDFMLINGLSFNFDEAPYIFREQGVLCIPEEIGLKPLDPVRRKEIADGQLRLAFDLPEDDDWFRMSLDDIPVLFSIPKLSYRFQGEEKWQTELHMPVWYKDLPRILEVRYPADTIRFLLDEEGNDEDDDEQHYIDYTKSKAKNLFECDLNPFASYYGKRVAMRRLYIKVPGMDKPIKFLNIYTKSVFESALLTADYDNDIIHAEFVIHGKAQYYADIWYGNELIQEKEPITDGKLSIQKEFRNGLYKVDVYETEDDDFGFDDPEYELLGSRTTELVNPADLTGRHIEVTHLIIPKRDAYLRLKRDYRLYDLRPMEGKKGCYSGHMVVTAKVSGEYRNDYTACIQILDPEEVTKAWVFTYDEHYEEKTPFLYDKDRYFMRAEEDKTVTGVAKYRRFISLEKWSYEFRIAFIEKPKNLDYQIQIERENRRQRILAEQQKARNRDYLRARDPLSRSVAQLGLSIQTLNVLIRGGIKTSTDLYEQAFTPKGLMGIHNMGRRQIEECIYMLRKAGYSI